MFGLPFSTAVCWIGTPIMVIAIVLITFWVEDQRDMTEWEGDPIDYQKYMKKGGKK